ncbi:hypothetical protein OS128_04840 [Corynebacterium sp. P5848]|uniref:hypothetical protein n=1 Tax=Corynebacterium marambiense TaxID=2765364 RepID=UPI002260BE61|nr:hypothetical protein [Corynebacterium marambiense]MCX7542239.1 hypothetical protein [Corynebacterium marambiense]
MACCLRINGSRIDAERATCAGAIHPTRADIVEALREHHLPRRMHRHRIPMVRQNPAPVSCLGGHHGVRRLAPIRQKWPDEYDAFHGPPPKGRGARHCLDVSHARNDRATIHNVLGDHGIVGMKDDGDALAPCLWDFVRRLRFALPYPVALPLEGISQQMDAATARTFAEARLLVHRSAIQPIGDRSGPVIRLEGAQLVGRVGDTVLLQPNQS